MHISTEEDNKDFTEIEDGEELNKDATNNDVGENVGPVSENEDHDIEIIEISDGTNGENNAALGIGNNVEDGEALAIDNNLEDVDEGMDENFIVQFTATLKMSHITGKSHGVVILKFT